MGNVLRVKRLGGWGNKNYEVKTARGMFILRLPVGYNREYIETTLRFLKHVRARGVFAPVFLESSTKSAFYTVDQQVVMAMPKYKGRRPMASLQVAMHLGNTLARLHKVPTKGLIKRKNWSDSARLDEAVQHVQKYFPTERDKFSRAFEEVSSFNADLLPQSIVHGDPSHVNCLYARDEVPELKLLDWDEVTISASLLDVAASIVWFLPKNVQKAKKFCRTLITTYQNIRPFTHKETRQLPLAVQYFGLCLATWRLLQYSFYYPQEQLPHGALAPNKQLQRQYSYYWNRKLNNHEFVAALCAQND